MFTTENQQVNFMLAEYQTHFTGYRKTGYPTARNWKINIIPS